MYQLYVNPFFLVKNSYYLAICLVFFILISCSSTKKIAKRNIAYLYSSQTSLAECKVKVHHISEDSTHIYFKVQAKDVYYNEEGQGALLASFRWHKTVNGINKIDSAVTLFPFQKKIGKTSHTFQQKLALAQGQDYVIQFYAADQNSRKPFKKQIFIYKKNTPSQQDYLLSESNTGNIIFDNFVERGTNLAIKYRNRRQNKNDIGVKFFDNQQKFNLPLPPFITDKKEMPITLDILTEVDTFLKENIVLEDFGTYFFYLKKQTLSPSKGISLLSVAPNFPKLSRPENLLNSLRYITKNEEYIQLENAPNIKRAIDEFWLNRAGSVDRGRLLIQAFYGQVQRANRFFTTYKEGWKTDRGLIYIIYGEPNEVYKNGQQERWIYAPTQTENYKNFTFKRLPNDLSEDEYLLIRDLYYEESWYNAVKRWRKGILNKGL